MKGEEKLSFELENLKIELQNSIIDHNIDEIMKEYIIKKNETSYEQKYMEREDKAKIMFRIKKDLLSEYNNISIL